jgi:hypothetical protein
MKKFWEGDNGCFRYSDVVSLKVKPKVRQYYKSLWDASFTHNLSEEIIGGVIHVKLRGGHTTDITFQTVLQAKEYFYTLLGLLEQAE